MKEVFLDNTINIITRYQNYNEGDLEKIKYGIEGLYLTITKMIVIIIFSIILGIAKEVVILLLFFNLLRFTGFGFHAKRSIECFIMSSICFVVIPYIMLNINISKLYLLILGLVGSLILLIYAPSDTIKRPLPNKRKRIIRKTITFVESIIFTIIAFVINNYTFSTLLICSIICESIMVNPITYKIFRQPYRNYLSYKA